MRSIVVIVIMLVCLSVARSETIALLPLDADKKLEVYGHPVAAEIGRALKAAGIEVVVVGAKMDVPDRAQLIVDGAIKAGKGDAITLSLRIRDPRDGTVLETLPSSATTLTAIDKAAAELSGKLVPAARAHFAALVKPATVPTVPERPAQEPPRQGTAPPTRSPVGGVAARVVAAASSERTGGAEQFLAHSLAGELAPWLTHHKREGTPVDPSMLSRESAVKTVAAQRAGLGLALVVVGFDVEPGQVPLARARVRIRVTDGKTIVLDRVIRTDTIVGDRDITEAELGARVAREVLAIVHAQLRRRVVGWQ